MGEMLSDKDIYGMYYFGHGPYFCLLAAGAPRASLVREDEEGEDPRLAIDGPVAVMSDYEALGFVHHGLAFLWHAGSESASGTANWEQIVSRNGYFFGNQRVGIGVLHWYTLTSTRGTYTGGSRAQARKHLDKMYRTGPNGEVDEVGVEEEYDAPLLRF
jgi:hypothetical protein